MSAPVVCHDAEGAGERTNDGIPVVMVTPRAMHENQRLARPSQLGEQLDTIHAHDGQRNPSGSEIDIPRQLYPDVLLDGEHNPTARLGLPVPVSAAA